MRDRQSEQLHRYFLHDLLPHLEREEREFLPAVRRLASGGETKATRVREDHAALRRRIQQFKTAFTLVRFVGPQTRLSLLWRLVNEARSIFARLKTHAAFEYQLQRELVGSSTDGTTPPVSSSAKKPAA